METFHIAAYGKNERERGIAREVMTDFVEHAAFTEGLASEAGVRRLVDEQIVVTLLEEEDPAGPGVRSKRTDPGLQEIAAELESVVSAVEIPRPGFLDRIWTGGDLVATITGSLGGPSVFRGVVRAGWKALRAARRENAYRVRFRGAIRPEWKAQLAANGIELLSYRRGLYQMFLTDEQAAWLRGSGMAAEVKPYDLVDTVSTALLALLEAKGEAETQLYDLVLHRATDRRRVEAIIRTLAGKTSVRESGKHFIRFEARLDRRIVAAIANLPWVRSLLPCSPARLFVDRARVLVGLPEPAQAASFRWNGSGELVGVIDSGIDRGHPDLTDRVEGTPVSFAGAPVDDVVGHGTHIAGIIAGTGEASKTADGTVTLCGIAPGAKLVIVANIVVRPDGKPEPQIPANIEELFDLAVGRGATILNVSWGRDEELVPASYAPPAEAVDRYVWNHPEVFVAVAAGNRGRAPEGFCAPQTLATPATAKNVLTVGACASARTEFRETWGEKAPRLFPRRDASDEPVSGNPELIAGISARGPTDFLSVKPDVVAPGTHILAPRAATVVPELIWSPNDANARYVFIGGTSMAAPVGAACAAIVRQYLRAERSVAKPSAALLKSILIGSARRLKGSRDEATAKAVGFPDFDQGFGRIHLETILPSADGAPPPFGLAFDDVFTDAADALAHGAGRSYAVRVRADGTPLVVTLAWTDWPGNDVQHRLTLNVVRVKNGERFFGNASHVFGKTLLPGLPLHHDPRNTVQQVRIDPAPKGEYVIEIVAVRVNQPKQGYAVTAIGDLAEPALQRL